MKLDGSLLFRYNLFFQERFGFLMYPFNLFFDVFNRVTNINFTEPSFNIPDIYEPFTNTKIISATSFNFNDLLENDTLKNVHNIYLIIIDAVIIFAFLALIWHKLKGVLEK